MIINKNTSTPVITSGQLETTEYSIQADGKMFTMLIDNLYKNKPGTVVREISTNALDSHIMAKCPEKPFEIHVPSVYEPWFSVTDFGVGMAPDTVKHVFTVLGKSTKDASNEAVGSYGLGSKSCFSVSNTFSVISIFDGVKSYYNAIIGENNIPSITLFDEEPTEEHNGVTVSVPIPIDDCSRFRREIFEQLRFLEVKPILTNHNENQGKFQTIEFAHDFGNLKIPTNLRGIWIVQGQIGYPLDMDQVREKIKNKDNLEFFSLYNNAILYFDIGEIEVTMSREALSYSDFTLNSIEKFIDKYVPILCDNIKSKVDAFKNDWDRLCFINDNYQNRRFAALSKLTFGKNGNTGDKLLKITGNASTDYSIWLTNDWLSPTKTHLFNMSYVESSGKRVYFNGSELYITPKEGVKVFVRDTNKQAIAKLKNYMFTSPSSEKVYMIEHIQGADHVDDAFIAKIKNMLGGLEPILMSTFPELPKNAKARGGSPIIYVNADNRINLESIWKWNKVYEEEEVESGYYILFDRFPTLDLQYNDRELIERIHQGEYFDKPIYAIKKSKFDLIKDNPNFTPAIDKAKQLLAEFANELLKSKTIIKRYGEARTAMEYLETMINNFAFSFEKSDLARLGKNFIATKLDNRLRLATKIVDNYAKKLYTNDVVKSSLVNDMISKINIDISKYTNDLNYDEKAFNEKYPMISHVQNGYYYHNKKQRSKDVTDYIMLIDKMHDMR